MTQQTNNRAETVRLWKVCMDLIAEGRDVEISAHVRRDGTGRFAIEILGRQPTHRSEDDVDTAILVVPKGEGENE